jgi:hypothetical protein
MEWTKYPKLILIGPLIICVSNIPDNMLVEGLAPACACRQQQQPPVNGRRIEEELDTLRKKKRKRKSILEIFFESCTYQNHIILSNGTSLPVH